MKDAGSNPGGTAASAASAAVGMGGAATAAAVTACCAGPALGPLVISLLGAGTAVSLEELRPYGIALFALSGAAIGVSFWLNARSKSRSLCSVTHQVPLLTKLSWGVTWFSGVAWVAAGVLMLWSHVAQ